MRCFLMDALRNKHLLSFLGLALLIVLAFGSGETQQEAAGEAFEVHEISIERGEFGNRYITGVLENKTDQDQGYIQVQFNLYDSDGVQLGSTMDNTNNLAAGGKWRFEAIVTEEDATDFELTSVTGF